MLGPDTKVSARTLLAIVGLFVAGALYGERRIARLEMTIERMETERRESVPRREIEAWIAVTRARNPNGIVIPPLDFRQ